MVVVLCNNRGVTKADWINVSMPGWCNRHRTAAQHSQTSLFELRGSYLYPSMVKQIARTTLQAWYCSAGAGSARRA
jgi:hypothetical protein